MQMYLFSADGHQTVLLPRAGSFPYADTVANWLIDRKRAKPALEVVVILDTNTPDSDARVRREGVRVRDRMRAAGICVLNANLFENVFDRRARLLRTMNFHLQHEGTPVEAWVTRQNRWQALHNLEDHRKNLVIDRGRAGLLTSHNLFDAAYDWHENLFWLTGAVARELWDTARASLDLALRLPQALTEAGRAQLEHLAQTQPQPGIALFPTGNPVEGYPVDDNEHAAVLRLVDTNPIADETCRLLHNTAILPALLTLIEQSGSGDDLLVASAYFSAREVASRLLAAASRGARVFILIDSFAGLMVPEPISWLTRNLCNFRVQRQIGAYWRDTQRPSLQRADTPERQPLQLRVFDSHAGPVMHLKTVVRLGRHPMVIGGQANLTPNSFKGAWLETDLQSESPELTRRAATHFWRLWNDERATAVTPEHLLPHVSDVLKRALIAALGAFGQEA